MTTDPDIRTISCYCTTAPELVRCKLNFASSLFQLTMHRLAGSNTARSNLPAFFTATVHTVSSAANTSEECALDPSATKGRS